MTKMNSTMEILALLSLLTGLCCCEICTVKQLVADCSNRKLISVPQGLNPNITSLILSNNDITELKNNTFEKYKELTVLLIDNNKIKYLEKNAFLGIPKLKILTMEGNQLDLEKAYPKETFRHIPNLISISISRNNNKQKSIAVPVIYPYFGFLRELQSLSIDLVEIPVFTTSGLVQCTKLTVLTFSYCNLFNMNNNTLYGMSNNVTSISFDDCKQIKEVESDFFKHFPNLQNLRLHQTYIHLSRALKLLFPFENKTMQTIDLNRVTHKSQDSEEYPAAVKVTREMMKHLKTICVQTLMLTENGIVDFEPGSLLTYDHPECFETIVFTGNRFSITLGIKLRDMFILKSNLNNIKMFDFSYNPTEFNNITYLSPNVLKPDASLDSNYEQSFDTIGVENYFTNEPKQNEAKLPFNVTFVLPAKLEIIRLSHILADVDSRNALVVRNASNLRYLDISYFQMNFFPNIFFEGQNNLQHLDVSGIDSSMYLKTSNIPLFEKVRRVYMRNAKLNRISDKTNRVFRLFPNLEKLDISFNALYTLTKDAFINNTHLEELYLQYNLLKDIPTAVIFLARLKVLDVSHNNIQTINKTLMDWMDQQQETHHTFTLRMWGNGFKCSCENVDFIQWIFTTKIEFYINKTDLKCQLDNGTETTILKVYEELHELFSKCENEMWLRIGVGLLVAFIICVIPTAIIFSFRWQIAYFIYKKFKRVIEKGIKEKYNYDIYLSYADDSLCFIKNTLVPKIEDSWKMKICIGERDFLVGRPVSDSIANAIAESRNVVFIISPKSRKNEWTRYEIEMTKYEKHANKLQKVIVINRDALMENIPLELDNIWQESNVIDWQDNDENGWDKLRMILFSETF